MLVKNHFIYGMLFAIFLGILLEDVLAILLFIFATVFVDVDHYIAYLVIFKFKKWSYVKAYYFYKDGECEGKPLLVFHTIEFWVIIGLIALLISVSIYVLMIFIGIMFHMYLDFVYGFSGKHPSILFRKR